MEVHSAEKKGFGKPNCFEVKKKLLLSRLGGLFSGNPNE